MKLQEKARRAQEAAGEGRGHGAGAEAEGLPRRRSPPRPAPAASLFGSVTTKEISDALQGAVRLSRSREQEARPGDPIKAFGTFTVKCKLGYEVTGNITVEVVEA